MRKPDKGFRWRLTGHYRSYLRSRFVDPQIRETVYEDAEVNDLPSGDDPEDDSLSSNSSLANQRSDESHSRAWFVNRDPSSILHQRMIGYRIHVAAEDDRTPLFRVLSKGYRSFFGG